MIKLIILFILLFSKTSIASYDRNNLNYIFSVDFNNYNIISDGIEVDYTQRGPFRKLYPKIDNSFENVSFNFAYKYYIDDKFSFVSNLSYDFGDINILGSDNFEDDAPTPYQLIERDYSSFISLDLNFTYGLNVDFVYNLNKNHEFYFGIGLKNLDYNIFIYNQYDEERTNISTGVDLPETQDIYPVSLMSDNKNVFPISIGYIYNFTDNISFGLEYDYFSFDIDNMGIDLSNFKFSSVYRF